MKTAVCTLFEGDYHKGVGVLVNSLVRHGFKGTVFVGFRGALPPWAVVRAEAGADDCGQVDLQVSKDVRIRFHPMKTKSHLTNCKPEFMLTLWRSYDGDFDALLYLDPDIVVNESWSYFEDWLQCGVALCEDVNSPVHKTHPRRQGWRQFYGSRGIELRSGESVYVNGGAIGTSRDGITFLQLWAKMTNLMADEIGGLCATKVRGGNSFASRGFANCFDASDQDSLNAAVEAYSSQISILGREAMGFVPGHAVLPHALGGRKPWRCSYVVETILARSPRLVDKLYWAHAEKPIRTEKVSVVLGKRLALAFSAFASRIYKRAI